MRRVVGWERIAPAGQRRFVAYWYFQGWSLLSLGGHVCLSSPNIEIHLPFGFVRVGWQKTDDWRGR